MDDVMQCNDALVADLYEKLVNWIVFNINRVLFPKIMRTSQYNRISMLDGSGFEDNQKFGNHWQQLQINFFNEQMLYHYNKIVFRQPCEDYRVQTGDATYPPGLLLNVLNEESLDETSSDLQLIQKFDQRLSNRNELNIVKEHTLLFSVNHTISNVTYSVHDFIKENRNRYENKFIDCFKKSESQFIADIIQCKQLDDEISCLKDSVKRNRKSQFITETTNHKKPESKKKKNKLLSTKHKGLPCDMLPKLDKHLFRSTLTKSVNSFDEGFVRSQLISLNVMHTINQYLLKPMIFIEFPHFVQKYKVLHFPLHSHVEPTAINCLNILLSAGVADYKIGKDKVLLRYKQRTELDKKMNRYERRVHTCQASIRGFVARKCYKQTLHAWRASNPWRAGNPLSQMKFKSTSSGINADVDCSGRKDSTYYEDNDNYYVNVGGNNKRISSTSNKTEASAAATTTATTTSCIDDNKKYNDDDDDNVYENVNRENINTIHNINNKPNPTHSKSENNAVKLYQKQIRNSGFFKNVLNESLKNFHKVNKEDWVKIFFFENDNRLISKFFCEEPQLSINNSEEEYDGKLIGLRTPNFAWSNPRTYSVLDSLKSDFDITKQDNGDVFVRSSGTSVCVLATYFAHNLHPDRSISVKNAKIFDMKLFRQTIKNEMHSSNFSVRNIEMSSMVLLNFFSTPDMNLQEEKVSMLLIFYHALDIIGDYEVYKNLIATGDDKHVPLEMWLKSKQTRT
ncbi:hypothetical protein HELRODRAFT_190701 [Helobdella robusta]|uniref:Uncharacterized protein n=1 Tax=Helobdella robusta TaxID=6412 RepID=T1FS78_HELRO|nr:hypothetical protein HELRODRAFT_190701 [Helobdella robusta]ESO09054.1 hypothetical protein HELRODRAFT_190701 [Helobdella robusta]